MKDLEQQLKDAVRDALDKGWSMSALAKAAGVSRSALRHWYMEDRSGVINLATASKLCQWLNTSLKKPRIPNPPE